jgi:hypothetical protein
MSSFSENGKGHVDSTKARDFLIYLTILDFSSMASHHKIIFLSGLPCNTSAPWRDAFKSAAIFWYHTRFYTFVSSFIKLGNILNLCSDLSVRFIFLSFFLCCFLVIYFFIIAVHFYTISMIYLNLPLSRLQFITCSWNIFSALNPPPMNSDTHYMWLYKWKLNTMSILFIYTYIHTKINNSTV